MQKRCTSCLAEVPSDADVCPKCGVPLLEGLNLYRKLVEIRRSTVKEDDYMIKQSLLHYTTAFLPEPANLGVEAPSSEGKTHPLVETAYLFPDGCVWFLAGLSPTALAHDYGELVDRETKEPLQPRLERLQNELEDLKGKKSPEARARKFEIQAEIRRLIRRAAYLVNLENRILLFLDRPNPETLQKLYPILSHDVWESTYSYTDRKAGGPLKTIHVILQGWPVAVFTRTKSEGGSDEWQQTISRFTIISPQMSGKKYREAIKLRAEMRGLPTPILEKILGMEGERWAKQALKLVIKRLTEIKVKARATAGTHKANMFWIPYYRKIGEGFPAEVGRRMRDSDRFLALLQAHAALNVFARPRLVFPDGTEYIICVREDFEEVANLYFSEEEKAIVLTGLSRHILEFFKKVVLPLWKQKMEETEGAKSPGGMKSVAGLLVSELVDAAPKSLGKTLSDNTIRKLYLRPLENAGIISIEPDPADKRRNIIRVLREDVEKTGESVIFSDSLSFSLEELKEAWDELIKICDRNPLPKNMRCTGLPRIEDYDGSQLTLEDLYDKYFIPEQGSESRNEIDADRSSSGERSEEKQESWENHEESRNFPRILGEVDGGVCEICGGHPAEFIVEIEGSGRRYACRRCVDEIKGQHRCFDCRFYSGGRCEKHPGWVVVLPSALACNLFEPREG